MESVEHTPVVSASEVTRTRCAKCKKYAKLLPGDIQCAKCLGTLALKFGDISKPSDATVRGGY
ncbi:DNA polymerase II large subunit [Kibdelosporangium phytohabitans]|nr:DNA polymerase II large subunit [Kibdelosporangium phytohabitans]